MSTSLHIDRIAPGSRQALLDSTKAHSIEALVAREHLSRSTLGSALPGDASLPGHLGRGSDMRLGTADTVPVSMNLESIDARFLREFDALIEETGVEPQGFGEKAMRGPGFVLRPGRGTVADVRHRPEDECPDGEHRERGGARFGPRSGTASRLLRSMGQDSWEKEMDENTQFISTKRVAEYLGLSPRTLESYRSRGGGPPYYDLEGVVRYLLSDVIKWASKRRRHSTSDDGLQGPIPKDGDEENDEDDDDDGADGSGRAR